MKRFLALVLLLGAGAGLALCGESRFGPWQGEPIQRPSPTRGEPVPPDAAARPESTPEPTVADPTLVGPPETQGRVGATEAPPEPPAPEREDGEEDAVAVHAGELPSGWETAPPAQRPHAIRPPRPRGPGLQGGRGRGGVGPTGHWSRFPPPPPRRGDARLRVSVADAAGRPVPGADVYLGPPATLHEAAVSFGDLRRLGATDEGGRLDLRDLPPGAAALAGNHANALNGPRGLDMRSSIPVLLVDGARVEARLALPLEVGSFGGVTGRVEDEAGDGVGRAIVTCGYVRVHADVDGRFEAPHLPSGAQLLQASRTGYLPAQEEVDVPPGGRTEVTLTLAFRERGSLRVAGRVSASEGGGVAGATVYLVDGAGRGTLRSVRTDEAGDYAFESLAERLRADACRLQAGKHTDGYRAVVLRFEDGLRDPRVDIVLPPRQVRARFVLRDAADGSPVTRCRIEPERLDGDGEGVRGFLGSQDTGVFDHFFDAGRYRFTVEAPDHVTASVEVELAGTTVSIDVALTPRGSPVASVTLGVTVLEAGTSEPVTACRIEVRETGTETAVARFEGEATDGLYSLPVPAGTWTLTVEAAGHERAEQDLVLPAAPPEATTTVHLR